MLVSDYVLELKNITKRFAGVEVLHGVSLALRPGEIHALLGENGAGKSTLIKVITGIHQPDGGEIYLDDRHVHFNDALQARTAGIAAIYQELSLCPDLNVAENIFLGQQPTAAGGRIDWRKLYSEAERLLDSLGVHLDLKTKARNLSIAQMQSVEIARAFSLHARILIMDEPTSSLTLSEAAELFVLMRRLRSEGTAIIFISHRLEELFEVADQVTVLRDGTYVGTRPVKGVTRDELIRLMVGRTISDLFPKQDVRPGEIALKVDHLTHTGIFKDISFELRRGEILGMAGLVGAGRTDVARAIFGVVPPTSGTIQVEGRQVEIMSPQQAISLGLAYVPEDRQLHGLITAMNITSNISLPILKEYARQGWLKDKAERLAAFNAARQMEVRANSMWQIARTLSGGNQQKVVLAKWLSTKPRILILDEPTRGIDVGTKAAVHALMSNLAAEGLAILMISSELPEVLGMSDRILVMHEGQMTGLFSRAEATQEKIISAATQTIITGSVP
jgi:rhamnose transport system ATP-binding protein